MTRTNKKLLVNVALLAFAAYMVWLDGTCDADAQAPFTGTAGELEAYQLYREDKLVSARTKAEKVLHANPDSIAGHFVLGVVLREAEGSLARAMYHLGRARELYETRWGTGGTAGPWQLHRETLYAIQSLAGEIEEYDYQLQIIDYYNQLYSPSLVAERAWPLLHLGRYDDARKAAKDAARSSDAWQRSLGLNAGCAIEGEAGNRGPYYEACRAALDDARRAAGPSPGSDAVNTGSLAVHAYNAALAALASLRFDEAQRLAEEGAARLEFTPANPWRLLTWMHLAAGRTDKAVEALREMHRWRARQPAALRDQDRADTDATVAAFLLIAGESEAGLSCIDRAIERPDRRGLISTKPLQALGAHALLRRALLLTKAEQVEEKASTKGIFSRARAALEAQWVRWSSWTDAERVRNVLADEKTLKNTLRVYVRGGIEPVGSWALPDLVAILGAGVIDRALTQVRHEEKENQDVLPYYDAMSAEVALARGEDARALQLAESALERLPSAESLLQARMAAIAAETGRDHGYGATSYAMFERAMQLDPSVFRRLGIAIPARVRAVNRNEATSEASDMLEHSPRLRTDGHGFTVEVSTQGDVLSACLVSAQDTTLSCATVTRKSGSKKSPRPEAVEDWAARVVDAFHEQVFAMRGSMSTIDLRSLDGTNRATEDAQRERMRGVLNEVVQDAQGQP